MSCRLVANQWGTREHRMTSSQGNNAACDQSDQQAHRTNYYEHPFRSPEAPVHLRDTLVAA